GGAVGEGIRERHANLEAVDAGLERCLHEPMACLDVGESRREVREQAARAFGAEPAEGTGEAVAHARYSWWPETVATVWTSLSPRPERVSRVTPGWGLDLIQARACAGSSAGRMPSLRLSRKNASRASVSPTDT